MWDSHEISCCGSCQLLSTFSTCSQILKLPESPRMQLPTELSVALRCVPSKKATKTEKAKKAEVEVKVLTAKNLPYKKQGTRDSFVKWCVKLFIK